MDGSVDDEKDNYVDFVETNVNEIGAALIAPPESDFSWVNEVFDENCLAQYTYDDQDKELVDNEQVEREKALNGISSPLDENYENKIKDNFAEFIIDCLCINHSRFKHSINDRYIAGLGESNNLSEDGISKLKEFISKSGALPSYHVLDTIENEKELITMEREDEDEDEDDDEDDDDDHDDDDEEDKKQQLSTNEKSPNGFIEMIEEFLKLSVKKSGNGKLSNSSGDSDCKNEHEEEKAELLLPNGFLLNKEYLRATCDAIKCRIDLKQLISFDLGRNSQFEISVSDLMALLLEITHPSVHKIMVSAMVEQQIPVPILYCMGEIKHESSQSVVIVESNEETPQENMTPDSRIKFDGYLRDNLHLASQSKVRCDNMTQSSILRNKPLIMFVGSSQVNGKSSMLEKLYQQQTFNIRNSKKTNPLHETSVDLIFLPQRQKVNYHILDVHGSIDDSCFNLCSSNNNGNNNNDNDDKNKNNDGISKMDCLVGLSSLCQVIILEITQGQLKTSTKMKNFLTKRKVPKTKFTIETVVHAKNGLDVVKFYKKIQGNGTEDNDNKEERKADVSKSDSNDKEKVKINEKEKEKVVLVIRDCEPKTIEAFEFGVQQSCFAFPVFCCPTKDAKNRVDTFVTGLKQYLNYITDMNKDKYSIDKFVTWCKDNNKNEFVKWHENNTNNEFITWWQKIEKFGFFLPMRFVKMYQTMNMKSYQRQRYNLRHFEKLLRQEMSKIGAQNKLTFFPFGKLFRKYSELLQENNADKSNILVVAAQKKVNKLIKLFILFCLLSSDCDTYSRGDISWSNSEYMYILDNVCNDRNIIVLKNMNDKIRELQAKTARVVGKEKQRILQQEIDKEYTNKKQAEVTGYDFLHDCQSLATLIMHYKKNILRYQDIATLTRDKIDDFIYCISEFSHNLFLQGTPVEFCDGGYARMDEQFVSNVFGGSGGSGGSGGEEMPLVSIAVTGPQSSGKSTLLRRLFGIEARASAGRTTHGINCCKLQMIDKQLLVVDTEGIASVEKGETDSRRDNKIILAALASSRIFVLNIMRDAANVKIMDKILWAYDKLNLNTKTKQKKAECNYKGNGKQLSDIKFIFVIRDCEEYTKSNWLETQKNDINRHLTDSLRSMNSKSEITSIEQLIGEPIYFPMPSAFDSSGAPNVYFSERCVELRQIILNEIEKVEKTSNNSYYNTQDWCFQMTSIWDHVVRFEDVLLAQNFQQQSDIRTMQRAVDSKITEIYLKLEPQIKIIETDIIDNGGEVKEEKVSHNDDKSHDKSDLGMNRKVKSFNKQLSNLIRTEIKQGEENLRKEHPKINIGIVNQYCSEFKNRIDAFKQETLETFEATVRFKERKSLVNSILKKLDDAAIELKQSNNRGSDESKKMIQMKEEYDKVFDNAIEAIKKDFEWKGKARIQCRFNRAYETQILKQNQATGVTPSNFSQFTKYKTMQDTTTLATGNGEFIQFIVFQDKIDSVSKLVNKAVTTFSSWQENIEIDLCNCMKEKCDSIVDEYIIAENLQNSHKWMSAFHILTEWLESESNIRNHHEKEKSRFRHNNNCTNYNWSNLVTFKYKNEFYVASHYYLKKCILTRLYELREAEIETQVAEINKERKTRWKLFEQNITGIVEPSVIADALFSFIKKGIEIVIDERRNKLTKRYLQNAFSSCDSELALRSAFIDAFNKKNKTNAKAWRFITADGQLTAITEQFEKNFDKYIKEMSSTNYLDLIYPTSIVRRRSVLKSVYDDAVIMSSRIYRQFMIVQFDVQNEESLIKSCQRWYSEAMTAIGECIKAINEVSSKVETINNTQTFQKLLHQTMVKSPFTLHNKYAVCVQMSDSNDNDKNKNNSDNGNYLQRIDIVAQKNEVFRCLLDKFENLNIIQSTPQKEDIILQIQEWTNQSLKQSLKQKYIGCEKYCPYCRAKCTKCANHGGPHSTDFHFLLSFSGVRNSATKKLICDVCTSENNVNNTKWKRPPPPKQEKKDSENSGWTFNWLKWIVVEKQTDEPCSWDDHVKSQHPTWHPISKMEFHRENVSMMLDIYQNVDLEARLIKEIYKNSKPHSEVAFEKQMKSQQAKGVIDLVKSWFVSADDSELQKDQKDKKQEILEH